MNPQITAHHQNGASGTLNRQFFGGAKSVAKQKNRINLKGVILLAAFTFPGILTAQSQSWEKLITPGLTYRMEIDLGLPRVIHAYRYTPGSGKVYSRPELAGQSIYGPNDVTKGRQPITTTIRETGALAGINADFFPWSGDPIGLMIRSGEMLSLPYPNRASFAWGANYTYAGPVTTTLTYSSGVAAKPIPNLNQDLGDNQIGLFTSSALMAKSSVIGNYALIATDQTLKFNGKVTGRVELVTPDLTVADIKPGQMILAGTGNKKGDIAALKPGDTITITSKSTQLSEKAVHAVGGGPLLVSKGNVVMNAKRENFSDSFSLTMHPRTAIGATKEGDLWLVVIDGRQPMSRGSSLDELARVMQRLGCQEAINLDGGGSSTLALGSIPLNRPSDSGVERAICNSVLLFGEMPVPDPNAIYVIKGVPNIEEGQSATYAVINQLGERVPLNDVIWAAQGSAWIDQSGVLRALTAGPAVISAWIKGSVISVQIDVKARGTTPPPKSNG
ncbi:MAG: phosphodiester glycosidase family protein [Fimbriimonadaceae bacterium]|nr:MAG: phosphodiester glycosidase family protein [Fimbriimonadaceae bacterium]